MSHQPLKLPSYTVCINLRDGLSSPGKVEIKVVAFLSVFFFSTYMCCCCLDTWLSISMHNSAGSWVLQDVMTGSREKRCNLTSESQWQQKSYIVIFTDCFLIVNLSSGCLTSANASPFLLPSSVALTINTCPCLSSLYIYWLLCIFPSNLRGHLVHCPLLRVCLQYLYSLNPFDKINSEPQTDKSCSFW